MTEATRRKVLVVDDDSAMVEMVASLLEEHGYEPTGAGSPDAALEAFAAEDFDVVLSDIKMPGKTGIELVGELRELRPGVPVVLMTAFGSIDSAVEAMRAGAFHYVTKPFKRDEILVVMERASERRSLEEENSRLRRAVDQTSAMGDLLGASAAMRDIFAMIRKISNSASTVLITGESGTGKDVVARTIHFSGARADGPYVPINCTAIPEGLLESELFGHVKGSFTGATSNKQGLFEKANGGTLFLDEIGDMGPGLQAKLLRVLQDGEIRPVGGTEPKKIDLRLVAATNRDLRAEIDEGRFRQDLFYRLNVIPIHVPPLRERPEDVALLAEHFARKHSPAERPRSVGARAVKKLQRARWEGNVRELENVIERSLALCERAELEPDDLMLTEAGQGAAEQSDGLRSELEAALRQRLTLAELEDRYIERVLEFTEGNKAEAAQLLGIHRRTLYRRAERDKSERDAPETDSADGD